MSLIADFKATLIFKRRSFSGPVLKADVSAQRVPFSSFIFIFLLIIERKCIQNTCHRRKIRLLGNVHYMTGIDQKILG